MEGAPKEAPAMLKKLLAANAVEILRMRIRVQQGFM